MSCPWCVQILKRDFKQILEKSRSYQIFRENRPKTDLGKNSLKILFLKFDAHFCLWNSPSSIQPLRQRKINKVEFLNHGHLTYIVNSLAFKYIACSTSRTVHILNFCWFDDETSNLTQICLTLLTYNSNTSLVSLISIFWTVSTSTTSSTATSKIESYYPYLPWDKHTINHILASSTSTSSTSSSSSTSSTSKLKYILKTCMNG
jgi:hypothetical protein